MVDIIVHEIAHDGLPDMERLTGRVAFIFDGCIVSGWPLDDGESWEANSDVGRHGRFHCVTHWVEFPAPLWELPMIANTAPADESGASGDAARWRRHDPEIEREAEVIYNAMPFNEPGQKPAWVPHGNSLKQDEARDAARLARGGSHD